MDLVVIGHVTLDEVAGATRQGGAAYYAAVTASRLGLEVGLLTSFGPQYPVDALPSGLEVVAVPSERTTLYRVAESRKGRMLTLLARAGDIEEGYLPEAWREVPLVMLCPVANEVDPGLAAVFEQASVGVLPQGWMRARGKDGVVAPQPWEDADLVLPYAHSVVVSEEDVEPFEKDALEWFQRLPVGVITRGSRGATLFVNGEPYHVEPDTAAAVDPTGAGDVFATTLLIEYEREGNPWDAAATAACAAAMSVEAPGAAGAPDRAALDARLRAYRRRQTGG